MKEIVSFLKDIFMLNKEDNFKVGLSQFKTTSTVVEKPVKKEVKANAPVKLSDLMRGA